METMQNLLIGVLSSIIASVFFLVYVNYMDKKREKKKYAASAGKYTGYGTTTNPGTAIDRNQPLSDVEIIYEGGNLLKLILKEINHPHEWHGLISMESNHYGTIIWRYSILNGEKVNSDEHRFGLKKFVYFPKNNKKTAYIMGDIQERFYNEILIEKGKKSR
jgi:hypothetical protein